MASEGIVIALPSNIISPLQRQELLADATWTDGPGFDSSRLGRCNPEFRHRLRWLGLQIMLSRIHVLILCTANSARSQMAEGLLRDLAGDRIEVASAGVAPTQVRPEAIEAMKEIGIDISDHRSKSIDEFTTQAFEYVITVCDNANQHCPMFPGTCRRIHWSIEDPAAVEGDDKTRLEAFRAARDELRERLDKFVEEEIGKSAS